MSNRITIITPVFNDWESLNKLMSSISVLLKDTADELRLIAVNDCSTELAYNFISVPDNIIFEKLDLVTNVGHQRAIIIGLCYCFENKPDTDYVIVMDSDGEDQPAFIKGLIERCDFHSKQKIIFGKRSKRQEKLLFKFFYRIYKIVFKLFTGKSISFGNFSCIPKFILSRVCNDPNFWNHYSVAVIKSNIPFDYVPTARGKRYFGTSKMNFNNLVIHGLSSLSVYIESIIVRILKLIFIILILLLFCFILVIVIKYFTTMAIPGWATVTFGFIINILVTISLFSLLIILSHLNNRNKPITTPLSFYNKLFKKNNE